MKFLSTFLVFAALLSTSATLHAAPVDFIDNGISTTDKLSGLEWLDVSETSGRSYNDVSSELGAGGEFEGWRYATSSELLTLVSNWTGQIITATHQVLFPEGEGSIDGLVSLLGPTSSDFFSSDENAFVKGILADPIGGWHHQAAFLFNLDLNEEDADFIFANAGPYSDYFTDSTYGSFLVRDAQISAIPLPPAILLFASAVGLLGLLRIYRTRKS